MFLFSPLPSILPETREDIVKKVTLIKPFFNTEKKISFTLMPNLENFLGSYASVDRNLYPSAGGLSVKSFGSYFHP